jgi:SAM-dependent methyltransferase
VSLAKIYYLHEGLPRQAPGSDASTRHAISRLKRMRARSRVLDIGCGPGRSAVLLAEVLKAQVTAIDIHQSYLDDLAALAKTLGLGRRVKPMKMSMAAMKFEPGSFDLIWAEGSAYFLGIRQSLETWFPLLRAGGQAAFTELCWLTGERPTEAAAYWATAYPQMSTAAAHLAHAKAAGYVDAVSWVLPEDDWWPEYLDPLQARMKLLDSEAAKDKELATLIADSRRAIDLFRRYPASIGYVFHLVSKPGATRA